MKFVRGQFFLPAAQNIKRLVGFLSRGLTGDRLEALPHVPAFV
jgi:hypothetical protein